ncbi:uncharacterized protein GGS22DRAFT_185007 [Annulohypoxylon maeteangense]|uniref:uncharacterized protein n=1 Tax=Annulohypoxylon maeteangense TaxID=1927788 RepID=UPI002008626C|nr:uncharacterized protein GGS22DRAFT_185007 [Annulohypoxylon maeteangense]KAI0889429.1 hypothetical protein GGS22DRAFT_185007 [Annulohypoxylon maeteangense]
MRLTSLLIEYGHTTIGTYTDITISTQPIWAFSVQVQKAASITSPPTLTSADISALSIPLATSSPTSSTNPSIIISSTPDTTPTVQTALTSTNAIASTSSIPPAGTLPGGAIAGIVIGVLGALALGIVGTFLLMRRRKSQNIPTNSSHSQLGQQQLVHEPERVIYELGVGEKGIHELDEQRRPSEMSAWARRYSRKSNKQMAWELPA